jgi:hypothetical protein
MQPDLPLERLADVRSFIRHVAARLPPRPLIAESSDNP